ncbi:MAG TPA: radical SAM protein [Thermoanaerobaculia bacterium]|nr:radical SAM protein [Thermoanaerobaculia bacterium]
MFTPVLKSARGPAHLDDVVTELAHRLERVLPRLDEGPAVLDDAVFLSSFQFALSWIAYQGDVTAAGSTLRAYCDITASVAVLDKLVSAIAAEFSMTVVDVASKLVGAGSWREPLLVAGRDELARGAYDEAIRYAKRSLNIVTACPESQRLLMDAYRARQRAGGTLDPLVQAGLADLRGRFCPRPFEVLVSTQSIGWNAATETTEQVMGASYLCDCAAWLPFIAGNIVEADSPDDVWNSEGAQEIRRSVLDGDYSYCSRTLCPMIANGTLPRTDEVTAPRLRRIIDHHETIVEDGPRLIALGHDSSCNLACPSCRVDIVMAGKAQNERLDRARDNVILPLLRKRHVGLHLTAWGDPFASRHYRSILEALRDEDFDEVKLSLLTNGLGLTKNVWESMPHLKQKIVELRVSVDAATKETYENVRRPGRWEVIRENLRVMGEVNRTGVFRENRIGTDMLPYDDAVSFALAFVVQSANFREMPAFVKLAEEVNADAVVFQRYYSFGHEASSVFSAKDVASAAHPEHPELQAILEHPIMQSPRVCRTFIAQLAVAPSS